MIRTYDIIIEPVITEKSMQLIETNNSYTFIVDKRANKVEVKKAIETIFSVNVISVKTVNVRGRKKTMGRYQGFTNSYKKAIVKLEEGQSIEGFNV